MGAMVTEPAATHDLEPDGTLASVSLEHPWVEPPAPGAVVDVAPGIAWLRMPLPFQLNHINLWLLEDGRGVTVVDTGVGLDDTRALWERVFAGPLRGRPITRVLATHFHPDHMGNAGWLTERWRTDLWCTQAEWLYAQYARRAGDAADAEPRAAHYRRHGCAEEALALMARRGNPYPTLVPTVAPAYRRIRDADALAACITRLLASADLRRRISDNARQAVREMTWNYTARRTVAVYERARQQVYSC